MEAKRVSEMCGYTELEDVCDVDDESERVPFGERTTQMSSV